MVNKQKKTYSTSLIVRKIPIREFGINIYTLQHFKWITNKDLLYELCSMLCGSVDGRGVCGRMDTCIYIAKSLCCSCETITTMLIDKKIKFKKSQCIDRASIDFFSFAVA